MLQTRGSLMIKKKSLPWYYPPLRIKKIDNINKCIIATDLLDRGAKYVIAVKRLRQDFNFAYDIPLIVIQMNIIQILRFFGIKGGWQ